MCAASGTSLAFSNKLTAVENGRSQFVCFFFFFYTISLYYTVAVALKAVKRVLLEDERKPAIWNTV